ncbi:MAG TPA: ankyrin repeat domain-containing protein [Burkholderiaceae bacterium]|nr:ankyrin repeat domain-containing protein [Burkholderiaceae bacterium]
MAAAVAAVVAIGAWRMQTQWMPAAGKTQVASSGVPAVAAPVAGPTASDAQGASTGAGTTVPAPTAEPAVALAAGPSSSSPTTVGGTPLPPAASTVPAPIIIAATAPNRLETNPGGATDPAGRQVVPAPAGLAAKGAQETTAPARPGLETPTRTAALVTPTRTVLPGPSHATRAASAALHLADAGVVKPGATAEWSPQEIQRAAERARAAQRALAQESASGSDDSATPANTTSAAVPSPAPAAPTGSPAGQLHRAADRGDVAEIKHVLATATVSVDTPDATGRTPLLQAVLSRRPGAVRALLAAGADPTRADHSGLTPQDAARQSRNTEIAQILAAPR